MQKKAKMSDKMSDKLTILSYICPTNVVNVGHAKAAVRHDVGKLRDMKSLAYNNFLAVRFLPSMQLSK